MGKEMRSGDIEALRSKMALEGRPMKSRIIMDGSHQTFYDVDKKSGKVEITEKLDLKE